jgi:hypothetical protein
MTFFGQIRTVCKQYPDLGIDGFIAILPNNQQDLLERANDISLVVDWLNGIDKTKTITKKCGSSQVMKRTVELESTNLKITNGIFIVGAIIAGFKFVRSHDGTGPNAYFNISCTSMARKLGKCLPFETGYSARSLAKEI